MTTTTSMDEKLRPPNVSLIRETGYFSKSSIILRTENAFKIASATKSLSWVGSYSWQLFYHCEDSSVVFAW